MHLREWMQGRRCCTTEAEQVYKDVSVESQRSSCQGDDSERARTSLLDDCESTGKKSMMRRLREMDLHYERVGTIKLREKKLPAEVEHIIPASSERNYDFHKIAPHLQSPLEDMLVDGFGRQHSYLRLSITERCNFRCVYCMPADGINLTHNSRLLNLDEIRRLAMLFSQAGVTKVRLTGGEPTIRSDLPEIVRMLKFDAQIPEIAITTNGLLLERQLETLVEAGISRINISLDSLHPEKFSKLSRTSPKTLERVLRGINAAARVVRPLKINVVVMKGINDDEIGDIVENLGISKGLNVRFIEYMPFDDNGWDRKKMMPQREVMDKVENTLAKHGYCLSPVYAGRNAVGRDYQIVTRDHGNAISGRISFVSSMTDNFCSGCNRIRILADGSFKVCLFGSDELSLRDIMRSGASNDHLIHEIKNALLNKKKAHAGMFNLQKTRNRTMTTIGG